MAPGSLYPAFIKVEYHSEYAPHVQILPVNQIVSTSGAVNTWTLQDAMGDPANLVTHLTTLLTEFAKRFPSTVHFDAWTLFSVPTLTSDPQYVGGATLDIDGSATAGGWDKATQETLSFRDSEGDIFKLVGMDVDAGGGFDRVTDATSIGIGALVTELTADTSPWRSRKDSQITSFIARTATLNEKLRRSYRMV